MANMSNKSNHHVAGALSIETDWVSISTIAIPNSKQKVPFIRQLKIIFGHKNYCLIIIYVFLYLSQSTAGGIFIPTYGAQFLGGCIENDRKTVINDCIPDYQDYVIFSTIFASMEGIISFIFSAFIGKASDSFGRKPFLLYAVISFAIPRITIIFYVNLYLYFGLSLLESINGPLSLTPAINGYISDVLPENLRTLGFGIAYSMIGVGLFCGSIFAILIAYFWSNHAIFIGLAGVYLIMFIFIIFFIPESLQQQNKKSEIFSKNCNPLKPLMYITDNYIVALISVIEFLLSLTQSGVLNTILPYLGHELNLIETTEANMIFASFSIVSGVGLLISSFIILPILTHKFHLKNISIMIIGCILTLIAQCGFVLLSRYRDHSWWIALLSGYIFGSSFISITASHSILTKYLNKKEQNLGFGIVYSYRSLACIIAPISFGLCYYEMEKRNYPYAQYLASGLFTFVSIIIIVFPLRLAINQKAMIIGNFTIDSPTSSGMLVDDNAFGNDNNQKNGVKRAPFTAYNTFDSPNEQRK